MQTPNANWIKWSENLSRLHLKGLAGWLLEAGDPLRIVGVQLLYIGQPFIRTDSVKNLAAFLEDKEETRAFAAFLRKE